MLNIDALHLLSTLLYLGEPASAKQVAATILDMAETSELDTIAHCADIWETNAPPVAKAKLDRYARELDEHHSALVQFCKTETGPRVRRPDTDAPATVSVWSDTRPGYDEHDAQPAGLEAPTPWEIQRAHRWAQLNRHLRDDRKQLPAHIRTALRDVRRRRVTDTPNPQDLSALNTDPDARQVYDAYRRRGMRHRQAFTLATTTDKQRKATRTATQCADDYARTRLGVEDRTTRPGTLVTIFDIDDHRAAKTRYRPIRCAVCSHVRADQDIPAAGYDDRLCRECRHVMTTFRATPCVCCGIERPYNDHRGTAHRFGHATGHDDALCGECRDASRPGLPATVTATRRTARTVAYLHPEDRAAATHANAITTRCAAVATYYHGAPAPTLKWLRAYYGIAPASHRPVIAQWVNQWRSTHQPQPPTPITPAAVPAAPVPAPVPALAAA